MPAYVASARIVRVAPRFAIHDRPEETATDATIIELGTAAVIERSDVGSRWRAVRERWSQLTFFLFDPNSWRS